MANFNNIDDKNFDLNGRPYPKRFYARSLGKGSPKVSVVAQDESYVLWDGSFTDCIVDGTAATSVEDALVKLNTGLGIGNFKSGGGSPSPTQIEHANTLNRDKPDQHPMDAISGLRERFEESDNNREAGDDAVNRRADAIEQKNTEQDAAIQTNTEAIGQVSVRVDALYGAVVYIGMINLPTSQVTQDALNSRASELGFSPLETGYTLNDNDGHEWRYEARFLQWVDTGAFATSKATDETLGVVKGSITSLDVSVRADGTMYVVGLSDLLASINTAIANEVARAQGVERGMQSQITEHVGKGGATQHPNATTTTSGFMTAEDKAKLNGLTPGVSVHNQLTGRDATSQHPIEAINPSGSTTNILPVGQGNDAPTFKNPSILGIPWNGSTADIPAGTRDFYNRTSAMGMPMICVDAAGTTVIGSMPLTSVLPNAEALTSLYGVLVKNCRTSYGITDILYTSSSGGIADTTGAFRELYAIIGPYVHDTYPDGAPIIMALGIRIFGSELQFQTIDGSSLFKIPTACYTPDAGWMSAGDIVWGYRDGTYRWLRVRE